MARPVKHDGGLYKREGSKIWWMRYRDKDGVRRRESTLTEDWTEAQKCLRERLQARDNNTLPALRRGQDLNFGEWSDFYLENFSKPPFRAPKTHEVNQRALKHLRKMFENTKLAELTADDIENFLRQRLKERVQVKAKNGFVEKGLLKATTVHQDLRVLRRMLNVAVRKKFLFANPCSGVEFPARVEGLFRPHYVTWSEQQKIEFAAPEYLRHVVRIVTETGLRIYKELTPMKKEQHCGGPSNGDRRRRIRAAIGSLRTQPFPLPERRESRRLSEDVQDRLACDASPGEGSIFSHLRSPIDVRHPAQRRRGRRRVGHAVAPAGRCEGVQEILANEAADEARGAGQTEPPSQRKRSGFWHSTGPIWSGFWHSFGTVA